MIIETNKGEIKMIKELEKNKEIIFLTYDDTFKSYNGSMSGIRAIKINTEKAAEWANDNLTQILIRKVNRFEANKIYIRDDYSNKWYISLEDKKMELLRQINELEEIKNLM